MTVRMITKTHDHHKPAVTITEPGKVGGFVVPAQRLNGSDDYLSMIVSGLGDEAEPVQVNIVLPCQEPGQTVEQYLKALSKLFTKSAKDLRKAIDNDKAKQEAMLGG